jgi:hypothetical protein
MAVKKNGSYVSYLEVGSQLTATDINANGNWPRDFIEALIRPDGSTRLNQKTSHGTLLKRQLKYRTAR